MQAMRATLFLLLGLGFAKAEYNVGDRLVIPITGYYIIPKKDYVPFAPNSDTAYAVVKYKNNDIYVVIIDSAGFEHTIQELNQTIVDTAFYGINDPDSNVAIIANVFNDPFGDGESIKQKVLNYLGISENILYDSDNDRIFIVLSGSYVTGEIPGLSVRGNFDPYYSTKSEVRTREVLFVNYKNSDIVENGYLKPNNLRKLLFYLYALYVLWSLDPDEDPFELNRSAFYIASKLNNVDDVFNGFNNQFDIGRPLEANPLSPIPLYVQYENTTYIIADKEVETGLLWYYSLEKILSEQQLLNIIKSGDNFRDQIEAALTAQNVSLREAIIEFHMNNLLNAKGFQGYGYDIPGIQNQEIYVVNTSNFLYPGGSGSFQKIPPNLASGVFVVIPANENRYLIVDYTDSADIERYYINFVTKEIQRIEDPIRYVNPNGFVRNDEMFFVINVSGNDVWISAKVGDTIGPQNVEIMVIPNRFALTHFDIYLFTDEQVYADAGNTTLTMDVTTPVSSFQIELPFLEPSGGNLIYYAPLKLANLYRGNYIFKVEPRDMVGNTSGYFMDTVFIDYLNPQSTLALEDLRILPKASGIVSINKVSDKSYYVSSSTENILVGFVVKAPGATIYYKPYSKANWIPLNTYSEGDVVYAEFVGNGYYKLDVSSQVSSFYVDVRGRDIFLNIPKDGYLEYSIYALNGRVVQAYRNKITKGIHRFKLNIPSGIYVMAVKYDDKLYRKQIVVR